MDLNFACTQCGKCCHDLKLPLSVDEAIRWAGAGHPVDILCEAMPWPSDPSPEDEARRYKGDRTFPALSADLPIRIAATLAATFDGPCPYLGPDMLCGNYETRPRVCRIYPAEIAPHVTVDPTQKNCPAEAWSTDSPPFVRNGLPLDSGTVALIEGHRAAAVDDASVKARLCFDLGIAHAALANEGYVVHAPAPVSLAEALQLARDTPGHFGEVPQWKIVTNSGATLDMLNDAGADGALVGKGVRYIGFFPTEITAPR